jgi:hypothetical protein
MKFRCRGVHSVIICYCNAHFKNLTTILLLDHLESQPATRSSAIGLLPEVMHLAEIPEAIKGWDKRCFSSSLSEAVSACFDLESMASPHRC